MVKKTITAVILFSIILSSCGRISPSENSLTPPATSYAVSPDSSSEKSSSSTSPAAIPEPEETVKPIPPGNNNLNQLDIITPEEAEALVCLTTGVDIEVKHYNCFDKETGFLIVELSKKNVDWIDNYFVDLGNGNVYDSYDIYICNLLKDLSVYDIMSALGIESLYANEASSLNAYLFQRIYKEMNNGIWYIDEYIELIEAKKPTEETGDLYRFFYDEENSRYTTWFIPFIGGGAPSYFDRVTRIDDKKSLALFDGDRSCYIAFEASDSVINKLVYEYNDYKRVYTSITDVDDFINASMLLGVYKDAEGNVYEFTRDRKAVWPEGTFDYTLYQVIPYMECTPFVFEGGSYGFQRIEDKLYFYEIEDLPPDAYTRVEKPFLVLEKQSWSIAGAISEDDFNINYNGIIIND